MEIGKSIAKIRKERNLTQDDLAEKYYVTRQTISNWENGKSYPDLETLVKISNDFDISLDVLLKEDNKMVKKIDKDVKGAKKYKYLLVYIVIIVSVLFFICHKVMMINKYRYDKEEIKVDTIFNDTLDISKKEYNGDTIIVDDIVVPNHFRDYVDGKVESSYKIKYDGETPIAFYSLTSLDQYVNILSKESLDAGFDKTSGNLVKTNDEMKSYLDRHDIKNDIDLIEYIKENYYFGNYIFTLNKRMRVNYLLNSFAANILALNIDNIVLISGDLKGYMINYHTENNGIKEIHLLHNDKQYIMLLGGKDITTKEFITDLLSSIRFK